MLFLCELKCINSDKFNYFFRRKVYKEVKLMLLKPTTKHQVRINSQYMVPERFKIYLIWFIFTLQSGYLLKYAFLFLLLIRCQLKFKVK